jgi:hypothetical protein
VYTSDAAAAHAECAHLDVDSATIAAWPWGITRKIAGWDDEEPQVQDTGPLT